MIKAHENWKTLEHIIVFVNHIELHVNNLYQRLILDCSFENIAKGRCKITIHKDVKKKNEINILSNKAMMEINIFVNNTFFSETLEILKVKSNRKPKFKIYPDNGLLINENSYLYVKESKKIKIRDFQMVIPIS